MGKTSNRTKNYVSAKGKMNKMSLEDLYYKSEELRTVLKDIARNHRRWGREWYDLVEISFFDEAKMAVITHGVGDEVAKTVAKIAELADIENAMKLIERGEQ